jgi:mycofactocin precursor
MRAGGISKRETPGTSEDARLPRGTSVLRDVDEHSEASMPARTEREPASIEALLVEDVSIDGMCGVY